MNGADLGAQPINPGQALGADGRPCQEAHYGMTLRQHYAGLAMQSLATLYPQGGVFMEDHMATGAVKIADALLAELAKAGAA